MLQSLVMDGIFEGVGSVVSFLPLIVILFLFLSLLEDSGYIARVAFVMDKLLRRIGLSGLTGYTRFSNAVDACLRMKKPSRTYIVITPTLDESTQAAIRRLANHIDRKPVVLCAEEDAA
jgi:hypothetical protein